MQDFEKLGVFYLGRESDAAGKAGGAPILYDSRDLVTHGVCIGMTGSGKTGLCISLIEEAAIDGVPVIAIDPKGDLGNLLLTFPKLAPEDFRPWIDEDEARRAGMTPDAFAAAQAEQWKTGLAEWGEDGARIERLKASAEFGIYTPGSRAGLPLSILSSFAAPAASVREDTEALSERAAVTATSVLTLTGADADPRGREHTFLSTLLASVWHDGKDLDLPTLIQLIQSPPFQRVGVIDLESFYPAKERFALAMQINTLMAAPGFDQWLQGEPLDAASLLYGAAGKPRISVVSIAHLGDAERMFVVTLLLNQVVAWMRTQSGTTSLRAIIYMDEIAGYFPPVANPPSKAPLLTLMKQARAFGVGVLLGDAEHGRSGLQGPGERGHVVPGASADGARQGPGARRHRRRCIGVLRSRDGRPDAVGARQACVPSSRHPRGGAAHVPDAMVDVVPARAAVPRSDSYADGSAPQDGRTIARWRESRRQLRRHGACAEAGQGGRPHRGCAAGPAAGGQAAVRARRRFGRHVRARPAGCRARWLRRRETRHRRDERRRGRGAYRRWGT